MQHYQIKPCGMDAKVPFNKIRNGTYSYREVKSIILCMCTDKLTPKFHSWCVFTSEQAAPQSFPLPLSGPVCRVWCTASLSLTNSLLVLSHFSSPPSLTITHTLPVCRQHMQHKHSACVIHTDTLKHVNYRSTFPRVCTHTRQGSTCTDTGHPCNVTGWPVASLVARGWERDDKKQNKSGSRAKKGRIKSDK